MRLLRVTAAVVLLHAATPAMAASITIGAVEVNGSVLMFGSGALDLTGFPTPLVGASRAAVFPLVGALNVGPAALTPTDVYQNVVVSAPALGGGVLTFANSGSGDAFNVNTSSKSLHLPASYLSGVPLSFTSVYAGATLAGLGLAAGSYLIELAGGQSIDFRVLTAVSLAMRIEQQGGDVVVSGSGSLDTSGLGTPNTGATRAAMLPLTGALNVGPAVSVPAAIYQDAFAAHSTFGSGFLNFATSGAGDNVSLGANASLLGVPAGYVSGAPLVGSSTYAGETLASLGVAPGLYGYLLKNGQVVTLEVVAEVPAPGAAWLLVTAVAFLGLRRSTTANGI